MSQRPTITSISKDKREITLKHPVSDKQPRKKMFENKINVKKQNFDIIKYIMAFLAILMVYDSFLNAGRVVKTHLAIYPINGKVAFDTEDIRWKLSNYPIVKTSVFINENLSPDEKLFTFRQSDVSYYTNHKLAHYLDSAYAYLYRLPTATDLWAGLKKEDIRYVLVPNYAMAEINNSSFKDFFASPQYSRVIFENDGFKIIEVLKQQASFETEIVRDIDLSDPEEMSRWHSTRMPMSLFSDLTTKPTEVTKELNPASITMQRKKPILVKKALTDVIQPWDIRVGDSPRLIGKSEFEVANGVYVFSGKIKADGYVSLYMDLENESAGEDKRFSRKLLWSGIVKDKHQTVNAQTLILFDEINSSTSEDDNWREQTKTAKLFYTLRQGGYLTVYDMEFRALEHNNLEKPLYVEQFNNTVRAHQNGWINTSASLSTDRESFSYQKPFIYFGMDENGILTSRQTSSIPNIVGSPIFLLPSAYAEEDVSFKTTLTSNLIEPTMNVSMNLSGHGSLRVKFEGLCNDGNTFLTEIRPASLRKNMREYSESFKAPCLPASGRFSFALDKDVFRIPPNFTFGTLSISDIKLTTQIWENEETLTEINYFQSSNIGGGSLSSTSQPLMIPADL